MRSTPVALVLCCVFFAVACGSGEASTDNSTPPAGQGGAGQGGAAGSGSPAGSAGQAGQAQGGAGQAGDAGAAGSEAGSGGAPAAGSGGAPAAGSGGAPAAGSGGASAGSGGAPPAGGGGAPAGSGGAEQGGGGQGGGWPTCDEQPKGSAKATVPDVWVENPAEFTPVWIEGLTITAISFGACNPSAKFQCLMFLQTKPTYDSLAEGKHQGIKLFVSEKASPYFVGLGVGDVVNLYGNAIRYTEYGQNELRIHVDLEHPGCAKKVGTAVPTPISGVVLDDLTIDNYENAIGPLLVRVETVKGRPSPDTSESFAIYETEAGNGTPGDGLDKTQLLTPYYLSGGAFDGLTPNEWTQFSSISGVYSVFVRSEAGQFTKYRMLGPRTKGEIKIQP